MWRVRRTAVLSAFAILALSAGPGAAAGDQPPVVEFHAVSLLPPGESGFYSAMGQAGGSISGQAADFGDHVDDQRDLYWGGKYKPGDFTRNGTPEQPKPGVRIYRDPFGVPAVYADTGRDVWWGAGYAAAQDRLFLMDAVRRTGEGTLAELTGNGGVPADIQNRVLGYSDAEYAKFFAAMPQDGRDAVEGYVDGANAWRAKALADPRLLPAEYALLTSIPAPFTVKGVLAGGVYITRFVATEGGNEMRNVLALRQLESKYGAAAGRGVFNDLDWQEDARAVVTIPGPAKFSNSATPPGQRAKVFQQMADFAESIPLALSHGPGTGASPVPPPLPSSATPPTARSLAVQAAVFKATHALDAWRAALRGGSFAIAVGPSRTRNGKALLASEPQLGYSYPSLLWELEVHGGGYDARGVSVPGLPTVGIGYGKRVAWALTTGYSKTIDSFIETTRVNPVPGGPPQYFHNGAWHDQQCRAEAVHYRQAQSGAPFGPPVFTSNVQVCRTTHGPVVATSSTGKARSVQYAMWARELETIEGILGWNRAQNLAEFVAGVRKVTWNENVTWADADGHIGFWHPGVYPMRSPKVDQRLPLPGTGAYDHIGWIAPDKMPHVIDPAQGFLTNWNNKPSHGWLDGEGIGYASRPAGHYQRVLNHIEQLSARHDFDLAGLEQLEQRSGRRDVRASLYLPLLRKLSATSGLTARERAALALVLGWDGSHYGPGADSSADGTDGPAPTVFAAIVAAIRTELFSGVPSTFFARQNGQDTGHHYDAFQTDNLAARILDPTTSSLTPSRDYTGGRSRNAVLKAALDQALTALQTRYGGQDFAAYRRVHPQSRVCSLTGGVIGPCLTMPYLDRGSWVHLVEFTPAHRSPVTNPPGSGGGGGGGGLPATGGPAWLAALALLSAGVAVAARRWATRR